MCSIHLRAQTRGSSLVETLVATALGLLALVMSTNSVLAVVVGEGHAGTARALMRSVEFARTEAAQRHSPVAICGLDARDVDAPSGQVRCAAPGSPWHAGWIVFGDMNLNGELDDGEAVLQVIRGSDLVLYPQGNIRESASLSFRPIGTLASATPRRILVGTDGTQSVCVAIDGFVRVLPSTITCQ